ncbi:unnamed protein product [Rhizoctonia solani]|uniref:Uncharacterized protein n=1 Tax=Rhizoctonia solani TaxID=456999 RepID=A0A8H2XW63_9AGAM|nr:unnamed protein product [Rhizoctonia solani]
MFKKSPHKIFTSSPLRNSDVKALRQRVLALFPDAKDKVDIEILVPKGISSCKFDTHLDETGVLYSSAEKEPLWFAMGKGGGIAQSNLIPTVPYSSSHNLNASSRHPYPRGADLMIPGVVPSPVIPSLTQGQLVSITQYRSTTPLVVGSMAINGSELKDDDDQKGKAVITLHTTNDALWALGSKQEPPEGKQPETGAPTADVVGSIIEAVEGVTLDGQTEQGTAPGESFTSERAPTAEEIETVLRSTTLYALARVDPSSLPLPASTFYSSHILPSRPARPTLPQSNETDQPIDPKEFLSHLDIKHTSYKKLAPFLKTFEKDGILKLKDVRGELLLFSVDTKHPALAGAGKWGWKTVGAEEKWKKEREKENVTDGSTKEIVIEEVWFPEASTEGFFEACGEGAPHYSVSSLRRLVTKYVTANNLQHPTNPKFVVLDDVLSRALLRKGEDDKEFVGRDELVDRLSGNMKGMWRVGGTGGFNVIYMHALRFPWNANFDIPELYGLAPGKTLNLNLTTSDDVRLGAWFVAADGFYQKHLKLSPPLKGEELFASLLPVALKDRPTILFFHGNAMTRAFYLRTRLYSTLSSRLNANVLAIDYRGFGDSEGVPSEQGLLLDARAAWDWLIENGAKEGDITVVGQSLGTGVSAGLVAELAEEGVPPRGMVLLSPYSSIATLLETYDLGGKLPILQPLQKFRFVFGFVLKFLRHRFDTLSVINDITCPITIIHATDDWDIPVAHAKALFDSLLESLLPPHPFSPEDALLGKVSHEELSRAMNDRNTRRGQVVATMQVKGLGSISTFSRGGDYGDVTFLQTTWGEHNGITAIEGVIDVVGWSVGIEDR